MTEIKYAGNEIGAIEELERKRERERERERDPFKRFYISFDFDCSIILLFPSRYGRWNVLQSRSVLILWTLYMFDEWDTLQGSYW